jgi:hypothetical protein
MRLAPIALVLLTCFALVTAIPVDNTDEADMKEAAASKERSRVKQQETTERWKNMTTIGDEVAGLVKNNSNQKDIQDKKTVLDTKANEFAEKKIQKLKPAKYEMKRLGSWRETRIVSHTKWGERERKAKEKLELSVKENPNCSGLVYAKLAKAKACEKRHEELANEFGAELVRAPLFFVQRRLTLCVSERLECESSRTVRRET